MTDFNALALGLVGAGGVLICWIVSEIALARIRRKTK
jgi:hypothetical protein